MNEFYYTTFISKLDVALIMHDSHAKRSMVIPPRPSIVHKVST